MFKKFIAISLTLMLYCGTLTQAMAAYKPIVSLDDSMLGKGAFGYQLDNQLHGKYKLAVQKQGIVYYYSIVNDESDYFPLQSGNGQYTIKLLENISGNKYRIIQTSFVTLSVQQGESAFLGSIQNIEWSFDSPAVKKAEELTANLTSDSEKIRVIYNYIVNHITYDREKAKSVTADYLPDVSDTYVSQKGICYDYASLFAAMLRSVNIPAKLVMGTSTMTGDRYHAWNEVYCSETGAWIVIDTTTDAALKNAGKNFTMEKSAGQYLIDKVH